MYAAEDGENKACQEGHRDREQRRQDPVKGKLYKLEKRMAADPHRVQAVHGAGLGDNVLKLHLESKREQWEFSHSSVMEVNVTVRSGVAPKPSIANINS